MRVDPRDVVTRPCAGCALPWNASFMTIPFEVGIFARAPIRFELQLEPAALGLRAGGFAVYGAIARCVCSWGGGVSVRPAGRRPCVVLSLGFQLLGWRISAGYSTGGYPPVDRMPHVDPDAGLTRRNTSHNRHAGISPADGAGRCRWAYPADRRGFPRGNNRKQLRPPCAATAG